MNDSHTDRVLPTDSAKATDSGDITSITLRFELTISEMMLMHKELAKANKHEFNTATAMMFLLILILVGLLFIFSWSVLATLGVVALFLFVFMKQQQRQVASHMNQRFGSVCGMDCTVTEDKLQIYDSSGNGSILRWCNAFKVVRVAKGFFVFAQPTVIHWIPLAGFETPTDLEKFVAWAEAGSPKYEDKS